MNQSVWKFEFYVEDEASIKMPLGAEVVAVGRQNEGAICLWAICDVNAITVNRRFSVRGTGHPTDNVSGPYLGTAFDGPFVWHVFGSKS